MTSFSTSPPSEQVQARTNAFFGLTRGAREDDTPQICTQMVETGIDPNARNAEGDTPLHRVADCGYIEAGLLLVAQGADLEARNNNGYTPLSSRLIYGGGIAKAMFLLERGANINVVNYLAEPIDTHYPSLRGVIDLSKLLYANFAANRTPPVSARQVYQMLTVWTLADPQAPVDRTAHMRQMFRHAKWESKEQIEKVIEDLRLCNEPTALGQALQALAQQSLPVAKAAGTAREGAWR